MANMPPDILTGFVAILGKRAVPSAQHNYYKKWLRYYLDFCDKYRLQDTPSKSPAQFLSKLREKKQTEAQLKQAAMLCRSISTLCGRRNRHRPLLGHRPCPPPEKQRVRTACHRRSPVGNHP